jgi:pimeloyl-ACP methyl ester carboxylesterase
MSSKRGIWVPRLTVDGVNLGYATSGSGAPVVLIHGALIADPFHPLLAEPDLAGRHLFVTYHRRGYMDSGTSTSSVSIAHQAADCHALLRHLGIARAHVVGHSYGGSIALQLALDAPDLAQSLVLLEPAILLGAHGQAYREGLQQATERYLAGDVRGTVDSFMRARFGDGYRDFLDRSLPGAFDQALADAGATFRQDLPALPEWRFGEAEARRIQQPTLLVLGGKSDALWPRFGETHRLLQEWLPQAESFVLPGATHALQMENPAGLAKPLADFFARHSI